MEPGWPISVEWNGTDYDPAELDWNGSEAGDLCGMEWDMIRLQRKGK